MKLTVLVDNNTLIDRYLIGEPGVSYLIECDGKKILFDAGYSDVLLKNAQTLHIDLADLDDVILSHGHNDHTWGLNHLIQYYDRAIADPQKKINLISHPAALIPKYYHSRPIGLNHRQDEHDFFFTRICTREPLNVSEHVTFLGQIPRNNSFEATEPVGHTHDQNGELMDDYVLDDSAVAVKTKTGLVIVTGCSHAGICNIIDYAKQVTGETRIAAVIGGFHLQNADEETLSKTGDYLKHLAPETLYPCHCTDLAAKISLANYVKINEVGVGLRLDFAV
ncbi:MBL fold metallo-hydrolase [Serratia aquatilis]|uniref:MBL fold metallo-hydrolase n=1 Tax=Serratia aquatilis TaxID=1737515 RepID=A0ABV6E928_9GAMM